MTEVTLKVMPRTEAERTLLLRGLDDVAATKAMTAALGSPYDVSGAAHLPGSSLRGVRGPLGEIGAAEQALTLLRLEGITASANHRAGSLGTLLAVSARPTCSKMPQSAAAWAAIRDVTPFAADGPRALWPVWRIVCPPASGGAFGQSLARDSQGEVIYDWGGGLIWVALPPSADAHAGVLRRRVDAIGGHATLIRAAEETRRRVDVFHPQPSGVAALNQRVKHSFDPKNILNRGRMLRGATT